MTESKLTGRKRHRIETRLFRKPIMVLQLEVEGFIPEFSPTSIDGKIGTWWIDARPEHLTLKGVSESSDEVTDLKAQLKHVQCLIAEGAREGFNCHEGEWAERLFHSNQKTSRLLGD